MWQILGFLVVLAMVIVAIKLAIVVLFLAGLIFKPKETVSLVFVLGVLALWRNYPVLSYIFIAIALLVAGIRLSRNSDDNPPKLSG